MPLPGRLPTRIEASGVKRKAYSTEVVRPDGGTPFYNSRWTLPKSEWDITIPPVARDSIDFLAVDNLFDAAKGSGLPFIFHDHVHCVDVQVRFKDDVVIFTPVGNKFQIDFTLEEDR